MNIVFRIFAAGNENDSRFQQSRQTISLSIIIFIINLQLAHVFCKKHYSLLKSGKKTQKLILILSNPFEKVSSKLVQPFSCDALPINKNTQTTTFCSTYTRGANTKRRGHKRMCPVTKNIKFAPWVYIPLCSFKSLVIDANWVYSLIVTYNFIPNFLFHNLCFRTRKLIRFVSWFCSS